MECYWRVGKNNAALNKQLFNTLLAQRDSIEAAFGEKLDWQELPGKDGCRVCIDNLAGGWKSPETEWPVLQHWLSDRAVKLERALKVPIQALKF